MYSLTKSQIRTVHRELFKIKGGQKWVLLTIHGRNYHHIVPQVFYKDDEKVASRKTSKVLKMKVRS